MFQAGILDHVLLIGSWCTSFYKQYFSKVEFNPIIRTRDIDFLVNARPKFKGNVDLEEILRPLGFEVEFFGKGYMKLESDELSIEFLVPEFGRDHEKPLPLPALKLNAQPLRHLELLWRKPITVKTSNISIKLPHPVDYALQKLVIVTKRKKAEKAEKDRQGAFAVLDAVMESGELAEFKLAMKNLSKKELKTVIAELERAGRKDLLSLLQL